MLVQPLGLAGLFVAVAMSDGLPMLPGWLHGVVLLGFGAGIFVLAWRGLARMPWPDEAEAARRLERDSGLLHQPLAVLSDHPVEALGDPLWTAHRRRALRSLDVVTLHLPSPGMAARDPLGLRAGVILALVITGTIAGDDAPNRLIRALSPSIALPSVVGNVQVWVNPPASTGLPPVLLVPDGRAVTVPADSKVNVSVAGGWGAADLVMGGAVVPLTPDGKDHQQAETVVVPGDRLEIRQFWQSLAAWKLTVIADALPSINFSQPLESGEGGRLRIAASASDDYGLAKIWVEIARMDGAPGDEPGRFDLPMPSGGARSVEVDGWYDLSSHPWAGLPVSIRPVAQDSAGQVAGGDAVAMTLPERVFANPLARVIVAQRRALTEDRAAAPQVSDALVAIIGELGSDYTLVLDMQLVMSMLGQEGFDLAEVQDLLWMAALRLEDGDLPAAKADLEETRAALEHALDQNDSEANLQRLLEQYRAAMERLLAEMERHGELVLGDGRAVDLGKVMESLRDLAASGMRQELGQRLKEMAEMLANLH